VQEPWRVPEHQPFDHRDVLVPLRAGEQVQWKLKPE
jgi:dihydroorotase